MKHVKIMLSILALGIGFWTACAARAEEKELPAWTPKFLGAQVNAVYQKMPDFHSPYEGQNSLSFQGGKGEDITHTYGLYLGSQLTERLQAYLDAEMFRGNGISDGTGLGGYVNGDVVRAGSSNLPKDPYVARAYLKYTQPLSAEMEKLDRGMDQLPGFQAVSRWEMKAGKMAATDDFDQNRYANNNRTQFLNYNFLFNTAWDYASDTRGYSYGVFAALIQPRFRLAFGLYLEPNTANGANFDFGDARQMGYNLELTVKPNEAGTVMRLLGYFNSGRMGSYDGALALAQNSGTTPSLTLVESQGGNKYGFAFNFEQPITDDGETGIFGRLGWNDGEHENWSYVETDRHASLGVQLFGGRWGRKDDRIGIAYGLNGLSASHRAYLAAGGNGILLGDGRLNYGFEQTAEIYYRIHLGKYAQLTPDFQYIWNPGYNADRGPVAVYGLRLRLSI